MKIIKKIRFSYLLTKKSNNQKKGINITIEMIKKIKFSYLLPKKSNNQKKTINITIEIIKNIRFNDLLPKIQIIIRKKLILKFLKK